MTTIVADQEMGYLAADRKAVSNDGEVNTLYPKIRQIEIDGEIHLVAYSGNEGPAQIFEEWYEFGDWDEPLDSMESLDEEEDFTAVILQPDGTLMLADKFMRPYLIHERWYAAGTGGVFAWAVLKAGCGIARAMETAIEMDPNSGLGYDVVYLSDVNPSDD